MTLTVQQLAVDCRVSEEFKGEPDRARDLLERILKTASTEVPRYLGRMLDAEDVSPEIVFIDTLQFEATVNAAWSGEEIGKAVAAQLARGMWNCLADPQTIRFRDRAELLARFMLDCSQGRAFSQSWHAEFVGLKMLPDSGLVRSVCVAESDAGREALTRLTAADLRKVLALLRPLDANRVIEAFSALGEPCRDVDALAAVLVNVGAPRLDNPIEQLELVVALAKERLTADRTTVALARVLVSISNALAGLPPSTIDAISKDVVVKILAQDEMSRDPELISQVSRIGVARLTDAALKLRCDDAAAAPSETFVELHTTCGGVWLLLPTLFEALPDSLDTAIATRIAYGAAVLAAGLDAGSILCDGALRETLGIEREDNTFADTLMREDVILPQQGERGTVSKGLFAKRREDMRYLRSGAGVVGLSGRAARTATRLAYASMRRYAHRLPGFGKSSCSYVWRNFLSVPAIIRCSTSEIEVILAPPPLDVIWKISGADRARYTLPDGREVNVEVRR